MAARELRFVEGKSSKFWRVWLKGSRQVVTYGRIGATGTTKLTDFPSVSAARASMEKLIAEKLRKGYVEASKAPKVPKPSAGSAKKKSHPSTQAAIDKIWEKIEKRLEAMGQLERVPKGASAAAIKKAEKQLGVSFPDDFRASYLRHDGGGHDAILEGREFLSLQRLINEWEIWKDLYDHGTFEGNEGRPNPPGRIKRDWWNPKWIPFTYDGSGNHHCLDLDPPRGGTYGQVITMWHDDEERRLVARSFAEFIAKARWGEEA